MKLFIDTSISEKVIIKLDDEWFETSSLQDKSQKLLSFIDETLKKKKKSMSDIIEIEVVTGPGSYTGLRVGVSVAQTLAWSLDIPVNKKDMRNGETIDIKYDD